MVGRCGGMCRGRDANLTQSLSFAEALLRGAPFTITFTGALGRGGSGTKCEKMSKPCTRSHSPDANSPTKNGKT
eukprot:9476883-Pyramimonas_sp.AAC.1